MPKRSRPAETRSARSVAGADIRFTTMFDLYGLPEDFPELAVHSREMDTVKRAELLEGAMAKAVRDHRLIPSPPTERRSTDLTRSPRLDSAPCAHSARGLTRG